MERPLSTRYDPRMFEREERARGAGMIYVLMIVVAVAFGGFVWQLYSGPDVPRIAAQPGPYKMAPTPDMANGPDATEQGAFYNALEGRNAEAPATPRAGPEAVQEQAQPQGPPQLAPAPVFAGNGPFVAQLAALQSEEAAELAWRRMASRAPDLFNRAQLDI